MAFLPIFGRYPAEARIIGELVAGYGEQEFALARCLGAALGDDHVAFKTLYRARGEEHRILIADALMRGAYSEAGFEHVYSEAVADLGFCRAVRNQYAHCHWVEPNKGQGLCFVELENGAKKSAPMKVQYRRLTLSLLEDQQLYFSFTNLCLLHLCYELSIRRGYRSEANPISLPKKINRPSLYSDWDDGA